MPKAWKKPKNFYFFKLSIRTIESFAAIGSDLVAKIVSQLTPFIQQTVTSSLSGSNPAPVQPLAAAPQRPVPDSGRGRPNSVEGIFGVSGQNNVRVETPNFNFEYDLQK